MSELKCCPFCGGEAKFIHKRTTCNIKLGYIKCVECGARMEQENCTEDLCWRLMDFTDEDFEKAAKVNSNTQLYKQAGNSICRNVLVAILGQMIPGKEDVYKKLETR